MLIATEALLTAKKQTKVLILATDADRISDGPSPEDVARAVAPLDVRIHVIQVVDFKDMSAATATGRKAA